MLVPVTASLAAGQVMRAVHIRSLAAAWDTRRLAAAVASTVVGAASAVAADSTAVAVVDPTAVVAAVIGKLQQSSAPRETAGDFASRFHFAKP